MAIEPAVRLVHSRVSLSSSSVSCYRYKSPCYNAEYSSGMSGLEEAKLEN